MLRIFKNPLIIAFIVIIALFFGYQIYLVSFASMRTETVKEFSVDDTVSVSGFFVRQEQVIPAESGSVMDYCVQNGQKVAKGAIVAYAHKNKEQAELAEKTRMLDSRLKRLQGIQSSTLQYVQDIASVEKNITDSIISISDKASSGDFANVQDYQNNLLDSFYKKAYIMGNKDVLDGKVASLTDDIKALSKQYGSSQEAYYSPVAGYFEYSKDGYENLYSSDKLSKLSVSEFTKMFEAQPESGAGSAAGKIVSSYDWKYAFITDSENIKGYKGYDALSQTSGDTIKIKFSGSSQLTVTVKIDYISASENGRSVIVVSGDTDQNDISSLRKCDAQIVKKRVTGLKVSTEAIRTANNTPGVYTMSGTIARFKPVHILLQNADFSIVEAADSDSSSALLEDDEVIVYARDLYDGKVVR